jgi:hypothetical protein
MQEIAVQLRTFSVSISITVAFGLRGEQRSLNIDSSFYLLLFARNVRDIGDRRLHGEGHVFRHDRRQEFQEIGSGNGFEIFLVHDSFSNDAEDTGADTFDLVLRFGRAAFRVMIPWFKKTPVIHNLAIYHKFPHLSMIIFCIRKKNSRAAGSSAQGGALLVPVAPSYLKHSYSRARHAGAVRAGALYHVAYARTVLRCTAHVYTLGELSYYSIATYSYIAYRT